MKEEKYTLNRTHGKKRHLPQCGISLATNDGFLDVRLCPPSTGICSRDVTYCTALQALRLTPASIIQAPAFDLQLQIHSSFSPLHTPPFHIPSINQHEGKFDHRSHRALGLCPRRQARTQAQEGPAFGAARESSHPVYHTSDKQY